MAKDGGQQPMAQSTILSSPQSQGASEVLQQQGTSAVGSFAQASAWQQRAAVATALQGRRVNAPSVMVEVWAWLEAACAQN